MFTGSLSVTSVNDGTKIHGAVTIVAYYNWNGNGANWSDAGAWTFDNSPTAWSDGVNAVFDIANATATLTADALASGKTATLPATVNVKISSADGVRPKSGKYVLTSFGGFDAEGVTVQLAAGTPDWVKSLSVNGEGNLELAVKRKGFTLIVK